MRLKVYMYDTRARCVNSAPCAGSLKAFRDIELRTRSHSLQVLSFDGQLASTVELSTLESALGPLQRSANGTCGGSSSDVELVAAVLS